jgi:hypothetical protein
VPVFQQGGMRAQERYDMKNATITATSALDIFDGDLTSAGLTPGFKREPSSYVDFPRFYNGPARCQPRRPFGKYPKNQLI